ncbi:TraR/DksA C4-type zinc finger protein [bacterium]|nr:TraR/DksA C4-type zinc finger protein [bacterium]
MQKTNISNGVKMDAKFIEERKVALEKRRTELLKELEVGAVKVADNDYSAKFEDLGDKDDENAAEVAIFEKNLSLEKTLEISLYNVNKALKKIDQGNYGLCEKCNGPINPDRLEAFPSATACMKCKEKAL